MRPLLTVLLSLIPALSFGQSLHRLYTLPESFAQDPESGNLAGFMQLHDLSYVGVFFKQFGPYQIGSILFLTDQDGEVTQSYRFSDLEGFAFPNSTNDKLYLRFGSLPEEKGAPWRMFVYEIDDGLQRVYDFTARLPDEEVYPGYFDAEGFLLSHYTPGGPEKLSWIQANGEIAWTLQVEDSIHTVPNNAIVIGQITDDSDRLPIDLHQINKEGQTLWSKQLTANAISSAIPDLTNFRLQSYEIAVWADKHICVGIQLRDYDQFRERYVIGLLDPDGNMLWAYELPFTESIDSLSFFSAQYHSSEATYMSNYTGQVLILHKPSEQMRLYESEWRNSPSSKRYTFSTFINGDAVIQTERSADNNEYARSYIFFDENFEPIECGDWRTDDEYSAPYLAPFSTSKYKNFISIMLCDDRESLLNAGFVSVLPNPDGGELVELTPINLSFSESTRTLQPGTINLELTPNPDLVPSSQPEIPSMPLATEQFALTELSASQIMHTGQVNADGNWEGAFFAYPWFDYTHRQSDRLGGWYERTISRRMGFQPLEQDLNNWDQYFEQIIATEGQ